MNIDIKMNNVHIQRPKDTELYTGLLEMVNDLDNKYNMRGKAMIEIGSYQGESTEIFAKIFDKIYAIDPWVNGYDHYDISSHATEMSLVEKAFDEKLTQHGNIIKIKETSDNFFAKFKGKVDFIYIDGNHQYEYILRDLINASKFTNFFGGHDWGMESLDKAIKTFLQIENTNNLPINIYKDSSWIIDIYKI